MGNNSLYWTRKDELSKKAHEHYAYIENKYKNAIGACICHSTIYGGPDITPKSFNKKGTAKQSVIQDTTDGALFRLPTNTGKVGLLNFASYTNPGGMFMNGSSAQEESLCHVSFLYNVLSRFPNYYACNGMYKNKGMYTDRAIYSPDVVFEHDSIAKRADVLTCAAPNRSQLEQYGAFSEDDNFASLQKRILFIRDIFVEQKCDTIILGAWGCGVFRQDPKTVASMLKAAFVDTGVTIVYAVPDYKTYDIFKNIIETREGLV